MYTPTLEEAENLTGEANLVQIYREISADLETPVSAYLKVARPPYSFLLESVEGGERIARYSFIGTEPEKIFKTGPGQPDGAIDPLIPIEKEMAKYRLASGPNLQRFNGGAVGYLSYEAVTYFEELPSPDHDLLGLPESIFMMTPTFLLFDHLRHKIRVVSHASLEGDIEKSYREATDKIDELVRRLDEPLVQPIFPEGMGDVTGQPVESNITPEQYEVMVENVKRYVYEGDVIQTVPSQRLARRTSAPPFQIYRALRTVNPSPYMFYMNLDDFQLVGASPEMLVQVDNGTVATHPIAGTRPRGATPEADAEYEHELRNDEKEKAEHIMLVDLGRNDIGRVSEPGSVNVSQLLDVEYYSHVMHLVSHVTGKLSKDYSNYDALRACFPAGTVSGAPKIRAMEVIAEMESDKRSTYAGAVGYFDYAGNMDTAITIRTMLVKDGVAYAQAGGGVVFDSVPRTEYEETIHKASALLKAIDEAEAMG